ncbi:MAG: adenylyltransferase/cytidyltransferase family protein [Chitinivibrionales bacterium]|nr:adenylyltransferase/cytidyltransferase family protein [Chitinivibrionales bacterium]MBD3395496.1 adenylyltransferase/cytidyltransferase family protein [Chitinivibrionales bacterium]
MRTVRAESALEGIDRSVVSIGNFDGVHAGHRKLVETVKSRARHQDATSVIVTFDPHTRSVLRPEAVQPLLTTLPEKQALLESMDIDVLAVLPFTPALAGMAPGDFVDRVLVSQFKAVEWVMGEDHAFGKNRAGTKNFLHESKSRKHFNVFAITLDAENAGVVSSTRIRSLIVDGKLQSAVSMLGHPYLVMAQRTGGTRTGSALGFPTLNFALPPSEKVLPPAGVYAAELGSAGAKWAGALYLGNCPTFSNRERHLEFHAFSGDGSYPGLHDEAAVWIHAFVRKDESFPDARRLASQIEQDIRNIKGFFAQE